MRNERKYIEEERSVISFRSVRVFMIVCLLIFGLGYLATKLLSAKAFPIRQVQVDGYFRYVNQNSLKAKISPHISGNFFTIDVKKIHKAIKTLRWVDSVSITRVWPDKLRIRIVEERPVARWHKGGLLNSGGKFMSVRSMKAFRHLPVFRGPRKYFPTIESMCTIVTMAQDDAIELPMLP